MKKLITTIIILLSFCFGFWCERTYRNTQIVKLVPFIDPNYVQPPCEAQRRLKEQGFYDGRIDNIWGPESSKAYANWSAAPEFEGE